MKDRKHIFIINPAAGRRDGTNSAAAGISAAARRLGADYEILTTEYPRHATEMVREKAEEYGGRALRFYACGGDGTLNEAAAGVAGLENASVTSYPIGSGNDFIRLFAADKSAFLDLERLMRGKELELDYIQSDCGFCLNVFSIGVDARIAGGMQKYKRIPALRGAAAYNISTVENLIRGLHEPYGVEVDGQCFDGEYTLVLAGNGRYYGGGANPVPEADPTDRLLDVLLVKAVDLLTAARVIGAYKEGQHRSLPQYIRHLRAKEVTVYHKKGKDMVINLDGEIARAARTTLRVADQKIRFAVPTGLSLLPPRIVK